MPNKIDGNGLQTATQTELQTLLGQSLNDIYGSEVDLTSDSPDSQQINVGVVKPILDVEDQLAQIYTSMDPDQAVGTQLDFRISINGIQRQNGTHTIQNVTVTVSQSLTLYGLDQEEQTVYTVADNQGNEYQLIQTQVISTPGAYSFQFRALQIGQIESAPNTINVQTVVVLGVSSVNNPTKRTTLGVAEESDQTVKIRRQGSTQIPSQSFYNAIIGALGNVKGVTYVNVDVNYGDVTNANGTPPHSIHVILGGEFEPADVAAAIYANQGWGGQVGDQTFLVTQADGTEFQVQWDDVTELALYIKFTATSIDGLNPPNLAQILEQLPVLYNPTPAQEVNTNQLITYVNQIDPNCLVTNAGFSLDPAGSFTTTLKTPDIKFQFVVSSQNTYILPLVMLPQSVSLAEAATQTFTAYGGTQTFTYSVLGGGAGGSIDSVTGVYTAPNNSGTDTVQAEDGDGNTITSTVGVA